MDSFEAEFEGRGPFLLRLKSLGSSLINRAISAFGSKLVMNQILELVRRSLPAKLLDVMTKLHSKGQLSCMHPVGAQDMSCLTGQAAPFGPRALSISTLASHPQVQVKARRVSEVQTYKLA